MSAGLAVVTLAATSFPWAMSPDVAVATAAMSDLLVLLLEGLVSNVRRPPIRTSR